MGPTGPTGPTGPGGGGGGTPAYAAFFETKPLPPATPDDVLAMPVAAGNYVVELKAQITPLGGPNQPVDAQCTLENEQRLVLDRQSVHAVGPTTLALLGTLTTAGETIFVACVNTTPETPGSIDNVELAAIQVDPLFTIRPGVVGKGIILK
jgi:hypothetical protein